MPDFDRYRVHILCEDKEHDYFVRAFFKALGVGDRKFHTYPFVDGACSAEGHVRGLLPYALDRIRKNREYIFLVAVTDVDKNDHDGSDRIKQWNEELQSRGIPAIDGEDRILCLMPKRNIETWFAWLDQEEDVDETRDYKQRYKNSKAARYGKGFHEKYMEHCSRGMGCEGAPQSILDACVGFERFCHALDDHERRRGRVDG